MDDTTASTDFKRSDSAVAADDIALATSIEDDIRSEDIFADDGYGDLIVHVGTLPVRRIFLVDSGVLCASSIKWRAILRHRPSDTPWHLPEDDPEAFRIAMKAAYYRTSEIPRDLSDEVLLSVGTLCSKYCLHRVLSHSIVIWERELAQRPLEVRLTSAWDLLFKAEFESAWKDVVKHIIEEEDGGLILRKVPRIQAMPNAAPGKAAKNVRRGGKGSNKSLRSDAADEPKLVFKQPTGLEEEVFVSRGMLNEEILERALNQRYECFSALSKSYDTILNAISLGFAGTDDPALDAKRGLVNDSSHPCAEHQQTLFDRLLEIARLKGLLSVGFPIGFKDTLPFDTQNDTLEEFANSIRKEIMFAGRDISCDDVEQILKTKIDSLVDGVGLLGSELAHFEPKVEEKVTFKRKRESTTATAQTPAPPVAPPGTSQSASGPLNAPTGGDEDPETKRQKLYTAAQAEVLATEAKVSTSNANIEISGQQGSSSNMNATTFNPAKDTGEKVANDFYQALSSVASSGIHPLQRADGEIGITYAPHGALEKIRNHLLGRDTAEIAMSGSVQALDTSAALEPLAKDEVRPATEGELLAVLGAPSNSSESDNHDSEYCLGSHASSDRAQTSECSSSREPLEERIEVAPYVGPEIKSEVIKEEG